MKKGVCVYFLVCFSLTLFFCKGAIAGDEMSLSLFNNKLRVGGDFYVRFETRSDYYAQDGGRIKDHGTSSRQRLSFSLIPMESDLL